MVKYYLHSFFCFLPQSHCFVHYFLQYELVGMEILTYLRFTIDLEIRCKLSSDSETSGHIWKFTLAVATALLENQNSTCMESSNGNWEKDVFLFNFFLGINICSCSWMHLSPHCFYSLLKSSVPILFGIFWICLNLSEHLPLYLKSLLKKEEESKK